MQGIIQMHKIMFCQFQQQYTSKQLRIACDSKQQVRRHRGSRMRQAGHPLPRAHSRIKYTSRNTL